MCLQRLLCICHVIDPVGEVGLMKLFFFLFFFRFLYEWMEKVD